MPVVISQEEEAKMVAINSLIGKVEGTADFSEKADVLDLLKDLRSKVGRKEILPNYLTKDIKKDLSSQSQLTDDVDKLLELLKK